MQVFESIVTSLEDIGVGYAFGGAGETCTGMMLALDNARTIKGIITKNEQAAAFMACGYAMFTNKLGVCFATAGPGAFNLFSGLGMAMSDSYPLLAVTGYANRDWAGRGSLNETSGLNNTPDSQAMFAACTKGNWLIDEPDQTPDIVEQAIRLAFSGRPGPVHIAVPGDLGLRGRSVTNHRTLRLAVDPVRPDPARVEAAAEMVAETLRKGKRVVCLAGFGAVRSKAHDAVRALIERFELPLLTTLDGKGIVDENHRLCIGVFCDSGHASAWKAFLEADLVIAIGNAFNQHATFDYWPALFDGRKLLHINISATEIDKAYKADAAIVGDARLAIEALHRELDQRIGTCPPIAVDGRDYEYRSTFPVPRNIHPGKMAQIVGRHLPKKATVLADAGAHLAWFGYYVELKDGQRFRKAGEFGPMAGHTNGALGVKLAEPEHTVVVGCGDGCYLMSGFELMTAVEHNIPVIWIICNDGQFKLIKIYQVSEHLKSGLVEFENPDYAAYARACGALGFTVDTEDDFEDAFVEALASSRPAVIDAKISRLALPHFSPSPKGLISGIVERLAERLGPE